MFIVYTARYNHSCEEYDSLATPGADPFVRICPLGVKSCFYITGKYGDQSGFLQFLNFVLMSKVEEPVFATFCDTNID